MPVLKVWGRAKRNCPMDILTTKNNAGSRPEPPFRFRGWHATTPYSGVRCSSLNCGGGGGRSMVMLYREYHVHTEDRTPELG